MAFFLPALLFELVFVTFCDFRIFPLPFIACIDFRYYIPQNKENLKFMAHNDRSRGLMDRAIDYGA